MSSHWVLRIKRKHPKKKEGNHIFNVIVDDLSKDFPFTVP